MVSKKKAFLKSLSDQRAALDGAKTF